MFDIVKAYKIPEKVVKTIAIMCYKTTARLVSTDGNTDYFEILSGVLQADTLGPINYNY